MGCAGLPAPRAFWFWQPAAAGGGGGSATTVAGAPLAPAVPTVSIGPLTVGTPTAAPQLASGTTRGFNASKGSSVTIGTVFPVIQSVAALTNTSVSDYTSGQPATLTLVGIKNSSGVIVTSGTGHARLSAFGGRVAAGQ